MVLITSLVSEGDDMTGSGAADTASPFSHVSICWGNRSVHDSRYINIRKCLRIPARALSVRKKMSVNNAHKKDFSPLVIPTRTLCGPGPSSADPRILSAMGMPEVGHLDPSFVKLME